MVNVKANTRFLEPKNITRALLPWVCCFIYLYFYCANTPKHDLHPGQTLQNTIIPRTKNYTMICFHERSISSEKMTYGSLLYLKVELNGEECELNSKPPRGIIFKSKDASFWQLVNNNLNLTEITQYTLPSEIDMSKSNITFMSYTYRRP